jgi:DNA-binding phage protein
MIDPMSPATPLTSEQISAFTATLVQAIHDEAAARRMSMSDLADRAGMTQERLHDRLEKRESTAGPIVMNVRDLVQISHGLGIAPQELVRRAWGTES